MNAEIPVFAINVEAIIYLLLYNWHDCTFNIEDFKTQKRWDKVKHSAGISFNYKNQQDF